MRSQVWQVACQLRIGRKVFRFKDLEFGKNLACSRKGQISVFAALWAKLRVTQDVDGEAGHTDSSTFYLKGLIAENQDGGVGRHTAPPRTTRTDRKSNSKEVRHQGNKKQTFIQTSRRGGDGQPGQRRLTLPWRTETGRVWDEWGRQSDH